MPEPHLRQHEEIRPISRFVIMSRVFTLQYFSLRCFIRRPTELSGKYVRMPAAQAAPEMPRHLPGEQTQADHRGLQQQVLFLDFLLFSCGLASDMIRCHHEGE